MSAALLLAGCASTAAPVKTVNPSPSASVSRTEVTAAAKAQYLRYFAATGAVLRDGGLRPERIRPYVTASEYKTEREIAASVRSTHRRLVGDTSTRNFTAQSYDSSRRRLKAYACVDNEKSRIVDGQGKDVTPATRVAKSTVLLTFDTSGSEPLLAASEQWSGSSVC